MNVIVPILLTLLFAVIGYISGNFLYAYIIGKKVCHIDLYKIGSGNPGSTNLARGTKNKKIVLCAFLCDVFKCYLPILISALIYRFVSKYSGVNLDCAYIIYLAGFFAIIGHCFPLIHIYSLIRYGKDNEITKHNKGGRGVATFVGFMFAYNP
jgi:glycerol-3-phosphate acyltransferase PlsY